MTSETQKVKSDGSTASYYELPKGATELQHIISAKNMNAQIGEIFRACMRYGEVEHSDMLRDINKMLFYAQAEKERLIKYLGKDKGSKVDKILEESQPARTIPQEVKDKNTYAARAAAEQERKHALATSDSGAYQDEHNTSRKG